jgi:hypothetical protein
MKHLSDRLSPAEYEQLRVELEADRRFRRKARTVLACALAGLWIALGAVVWMVAL